MRRHCALALLLALVGCGGGDDGPSKVTVSGRVIEDGLGLRGGVKIEVWSATEGEATGHEATSDSVGRFAVEAPARSEVFFKCTALGCAATNSRIVETGSSPVEGLDLWVLTLDARASAASGAASAAGVTADVSGRGLVVGILFDEAGHAVTGARVAIDTSDGQTGIAYTDHEGVYGQLPFTLGLLPTSQFAAVNVPGGEFELSQDVDATVARATSVAGEVTALVVHGLMDYCAVIGSVTDEQQNAVPQASVQAYDDAGALIAETATDDDGTFAITGLAAGTELYVHTSLTGGATEYVACNTRYYLLPDDEPYLGIGAPLVAKTYLDTLIAEMEADFSDLTFTYDDTKAVLASRLSDATGALVTGAEVTMSQESGTAGYLDSAGSFESGGIRYTDTQDATDQPQWLAANVDLGQLDLGQSLDGSTVTLPCREGEVTYAGFEKLPRLVAIGGVVVDETGMGVVGAVVKVDGTSIEATTSGAGQEGRFQLASNATDQLRAGDRVSLEVTPTTDHCVTNTPYFDLPGADYDCGFIVALTSNGTDGYYEALVAEFETVHGAGSVDTQLGVIVGAVRDVQIGDGPGKVDGAAITMSPVSGDLDYLFYDTVDGADEFGAAATDDTVYGFAMFMIANVALGDVTLTEDWDGTSLDCPARQGEVTVADFRNRTPQNSISGWVAVDNNAFDPAGDATVDLYDEGGNLVASTVSESDGTYSFEHVRAFKRVFLSVSKTGHVTTNTEYKDVEYSDLGFVIPSIYTQTFDSLAVDAWDDVLPAPDMSSRGAVTGDVLTTLLAKLAGVTVELEGKSVEVGYLDDTEAFGTAATQAGPQLDGQGAPQFFMYDVEPGDHVVAQVAGGDGKDLGIPVRAGEYTHLAIGGVAVVAANRVVDMSGRITDDAKPVPNPIPDAVVRIAESAYSTVTDANGQYTLSNVPARARITLNISKDGLTLNYPYMEAAATTSLNLMFFNPVMVDVIELQLEAAIGELDAENKAIVFGMVQRSGAGVEGVSVGLTPESGDVVYFDQYLRATGSATLAEGGGLFVIGNVEPGDVVLTQDYNWQRVELRAGAGEWTLGFVELLN